MPKIMTINDKVTKRLTRLKQNYAKETGEFISYSGVIESLLRKSGDWKLNKKGKKGN